MTSWANYMNKEELFPHELNHLDYLREHAGECTLFLKRDDESFPLKETCSITLIGNGVRHTVIGGTGSGEVNTRYKPNIEEAFKEAGFNISSTQWLDEYDIYREKLEKDFINEVKKEAKEHHTIAASYSMGKVPYEKDYEFPIIGDHEVAIYVLSRNEGEGADRKLIKGDVYLTDSEIRDIHYLNEHYSKFLLVLNIPSVIDLSEVKDVKNILLLSQLGSVTSEVLVDIVLGKINPSGKLVDTFANISDYPYIDTPISEDETKYLEGSYVGYRYFSSKDIKPLFPFGFGLSYTKFEHKVTGYSLDGDKVHLKVNVSNHGSYPGKEVIQVYLSSNSGARPKLELVAYKKSKELQPKESELLFIEFSLRDFPIYKEDIASYVLEKGSYIVKVGNSSEDLEDIFAISNKEDVIIRKVRNSFDKVDFTDLVIDRVESKINVPVFELDHTSIKCEEIDYLPKGNDEIPEFVSNLKDDELILLCLGDYKTGVRGLIGQSCSKIVGGAGETSLRINSLDEYVTMVDGPAGIRICQEYVINNKGEFPVKGDSIWTSLENYLPSPLPYFLSYKRNLNKKGSHVIQACTALPIATAVAQSFSNDFQSRFGRIIKEEMEIYDIDVWLAPALNIHRHILCGRNFEYYSEDPLVSAIAASNIVNAVQENKSKAVTIKHFACNNIESNRINNNSIVSEKAIREIYLPAFEKTIKWSNPKAIMASYNLINGIHSAEHSGLLQDILRTEWSYKGLVMTDWIKSGQTYKKHNMYPAAYASHNLKHGTNICMPGSKDDIKDIKNALKEGYLSRSELENSATVVFNFIKSLKGSGK